MERRKKTRSSKNSARDGESGNGDSAGSGDQRNNRRPTGDALVGAKPSSCRQQALRGFAGNGHQRLAQFVSHLVRLRDLVQQVADLQVRRRNLKNEILTLQDENAQLQLALNRERKKMEFLWTAMEKRRRPPGMSPPRPQVRQPLQPAGHYQHGAHPAAAPYPLYVDDMGNADGARHASSFLPFLMPWNVNESDVVDFEDFEEDLQNYISYRASSPVESFVEGCSALSSFLSLGGAAEAMGANPPMHAHRFQFLDAHRQRLQQECQPQELPIQQEQQQVGRPLQRQQHRLQRQQQRQQQQQQQHQQQQNQQRQQQLLLQHQRSIFRYPRPRRQEGSMRAASAANENTEAQREPMTGHDHGSQGDDVTDSGRARGRNAVDLEYEQLPLD
ncbi:uncharacterized protein [Dermacentor albipictus]|uniref:uncharacterized protein n=1 Tax=Dermacentor albipictus TaxID=60249 RepID=UPI0038FC1040